MMKNMKKFVSVLLSVVMILMSMLSITVSAATPTLTVSSATAKAGETINLAVTMSNNPGVAGLYLDVVYDGDVLTLTGATDKEVIGGETLNPAENILFWNNAKNQEGNGEIVTLTFKVADNAAAGNYTVNLVSDPDSTVDKDYETVDFDIVAGTITVEAEGGDGEETYTNPTIKVGSATAKAGETFDVAVTMYNNPGVAGLYLDVVYDGDVLTLTGATDKEVIGGETLNPAENILFWNNAKNQEGNGEIVTLTFKVADNAAAGNYTVNLVSDPDSTVDKDYETVDFDIVAGTITVEGEPEPEYTYTATKFNKTADGLALEVAYTETANVAGKVLVASYANDGKTLIDVVFVDVDVAADKAQTIDYSALNTTGATSYKAMLWADLANCMPIIDAIDWK